MRNFFTAAVGGLVALVGLAGVANASATIDLLWAANGTSTISNVALEGVITLNVRLTAGPLGSSGAQVTVDYSQALGKVAVVSFMNTPNVPTNVFPVTLAAPTDTGSAITGINSACLCFASVGTGLTAAGQTAQIGTVTFRKSALGNGTFTFRSALVGTDGINDLVGNPVANPTLRSATLINAPEPGAISLLVMALGGVALAGRGRRS